MVLDTTPIDLGGQVAIVTGGGRGLGRGMALALAAAGAAVAVVGRSAETLAETVELIAQAGGRAMAISADVSDEEAVPRMVEQVEQTLGPVDLLVNNAGITGPAGPMWEHPAAEWRRAIDVNLIGPFLCTHAVLQGMTARRRGRIINVASAGALFTMPYLSAYFVSKTALTRFTECLALDVESHGIAAFAINPGTVMTDMGTYLLESEAGRTYLPWFRDFVLAGGAVPGALSADLVVLLASGRADRLSGRFIQVGDDVERMVASVEQIAAEDLYTLRLKALPT